MWRLCFLALALLGFEFGLSLVCLGFELFEFGLRRVLLFPLIGSIVRCCCRSRILLKKVRFLAWCLCFLGL